MQIRVNWAIPGLSLVLSLSMLGCGKEESTPQPSAKPSAAAAPAPTPAPSAPPAASTAAPEPPPAPSGPPVECPKGSTGEGSFDKPCMASGTARAMEVTWNKKKDDKDPTFRVINKMDGTILYGKIAVYFYDKAGKQLEVPPRAGTEDKPKPYQTCSGNMFGGVMKPAEKAFFTFSCVKKERVPGGTVAIEAEMQTVGFADEEGKKVTSYWRNPDLMPTERPKGGVKATKKK
jgi:hypothetical protein